MSTPIGIGTDPLGRAPLRRPGGGGGGSSVSPAESYLARIAGRLDPDSTYIATKFVNVLAGAVIENNLNSRERQPFNGIIASIETGKVRVYFGSLSATEVVTAKPDLTFFATSSPIYIPIPQRNDMVTIWVAADSPDATTTGSIILVNY